MKLRETAKKFGKRLVKAFRQAAKVTLFKMSRQAERGGRGGPDRGGSTRGMGRPNRGGGPGQGGRPPPPRPVETRLADLCLDGDSVHVITNHFNLRWTEGGSAGESNQFIVHQYHVEFSPKDVSAHIKRHLVDKAKDLFKAQYLFDGDAQLYCPNKFTTSEIKVTSDTPENQKDAVKYEYVIAYTKSIPHPDPVYQQIYNLIVRKCLFAMGLDEVGQNFFDANASIEYPDLKLELWPGYVTSVKSSETGTLLAVDVTHKVIRTTNLLDIIHELENSYENEKRSGSASKTLEDYILERIQGCAVITPYNKKTYIVNGIKKDYPIVDFKFEWKEGQEISLLDYYKTRYNVEIQDKSQPLIISSVRFKRGEGEKRGREPVVLIPELCNLAGLSDEMRANMTVMKKLAEHLHMKPSDRVSMIQDFMDKLGKNAKCNEIIRGWGFQLETNLKPCTIGTLLPPQNVIFENRRGFKADEKGDWTKALRSMKMMVCEPLKNWVLVCGGRDEGKAMEFVQTMQKVANPLGFHVAPPSSVEKLTDTRVSSYLRKLEEVGQKKKGEVQMIFCVLPGSSPTGNAEIYGAIKKRLTQEYGIVSQCLLSKNLYSKSVMSIATKVVVQMNTKLGGEPWSVEIPKEFKDQTLAIGFDFYGKAGKTGAVVASLNADHSRYYSLVFQYSEGKALKEQLESSLGQILDKYISVNSGKTPNTVIFYRNNVDEGQITCGIMEDDARSFNKAMLTWCNKNKMKEIDLIYVALGRRNVTRLMAHQKCSCEAGVSADKITNAPPGTVVDKDIIEISKYREFYMVPTVARQGTVRAIHYRLLLETAASKIPLPLLEAYTFKLCHLYYNWSGTVNTPSVCQYAGKLVKQASQCFGNGKPKENLNYLLHYL